jgi:4-hydroxy-tetrahydrodipicolinate reductase
MESLQIAIIGGTGRLGSTIARLYKKSILISSKSEKVDFESVDVFIDVSSPNIIEKYLKEIVNKKKPLVVGSTGHTPHTEKLLVEASKTIPVLIAPNFSFGIALVKNLLKQIPIQPEKIIETHHLNKKDTPSGTAKLLSSLFSSPPPIESIRKEGAIGTHTICYCFDGEEMEITHKAKSLEVFAKGALAAASFLSKKGKGLYTMEEIY